MGIEMKLKIEIEMDNDAFQGDPGGEVERILKTVSVRLDRHFGYAPDKEFSCGVMDANGNTVGRVELDGVSDG